MYLQLSVGDIINLVNADMDGIYTGPVAPAVEQITTGGLASIAKLYGEQLVISMFYTYVLKSQKDKRLYVGSTSDIEARLKKHNAGDVEATKNRRPLYLIYYEACLDKAKAQKRERYFKTGFGREFLKNRL